VNSYSVHNSDQFLTLWIRYELFGFIKVRGGGGSCRVEQLLAHQEQLCFTDLRVSDLTPLAFHVPFISSFVILLSVGYMLLSSLARTLGLWVRIPRKA
jgi:hypothetical protein